MNAFLGCVMLVLCGNIAGNLRKDFLKKMCPALKLPNGKVTYLRARHEQNPRVQFNCTNNFGLIGERGATCLSVTRLSTSVPFCARPGCPEIPARDDVRVTRLEEGRVLHFQCGPGMRRQKGPQTLLCDGDRWNGLPPDCVRVAMPNCNFEHPYLCGWSQDFNDDHDWQWASKATPIRETGPLEDYKEKIDHYIFVDNAFPNKPRHVTRLISPTLLPSSGLCMAFDYQIHGLGKQRELGFLDIYIKSAKKEEIQIFHQECDKGNKWIKGETTIPVQFSDFQVVISATRGNSSVGYMALDNINFSSCTKQAAGKFKSTSPQFSERFAADRSDLTTVLVPSFGVTGRLKTSKRGRTTTRETTLTQSLAEISSTQNRTELTLGISLKTVGSPRPVTPPDGLLHSSNYLPLSPLITDGPTEASSFGTNTANTISATADTVVNPSWTADTRDNTSVNDDERRSTSLDTNNTSKDHAPVSTTVTTRDSVTFSLTEDLGTRMITEVADTLGSTELRLVEVSVTSTPSGLSSPRYVSSSEKAEPEAADRRQIETEPAVNTVTHDPPAVNTVTHDPPAVNTVTHDPPAINTVTHNPPAPSKKTTDVIRKTAIFKTTDKKNENFDKGNDHIENNTRYRKQKRGGGLRVSDYLPLLGAVSFGLFLGMFLIGFAAWKWAQKQGRKSEKVNNETTEDNDVIANA